MTIHGASASSAGTYKVQVDAMDLDQTQALATAEFVVKLTETSVTSAEEDPCKSRPESHDCRCLRNPVDWACQKTHENMETIRPARKLPAKRTYNIGPSIHDLLTLEYGSESDLTKSNPLTYGPIDGDGTESTNSIRTNQLAGHSIDFTFTNTP